ncbi:MAG: cell division protein FtsQ/DivIB [Pseudomonadota bacterium]
MTPKKSAAKRPPRKKSARRAGAAKPSLLAAFRAALARRLRLAVAFGLVGSGLLGLFMLLSGGYFADAARRIDLASQDAAVDAGFAIRRVTVRGREHAEAEEIRAAVGDIVGGSLLHFDPYAARERVEAIGWVKRAAVQRLWPDLIHVSIREREPAAIWQYDRRWRLIDVDGATIGAAETSQWPGLPLIVGGGAPEAVSPLLHALAATPVIRERTSAVIRVGNRRWNIRLKSGADIKLPEEGYARALKEIERLHQLHATLDQQLDYIDARDPERLAIRPLAGGGS